MCIEKRGFRALRGFASVVGLEVALSKLCVRFVLMPSHHEITVGFDPVNPIEVVRVDLRKIERDLRFRVANRVRRSEEPFRCDRSPNSDLVPGRRVISDSFDRKVR